MVQFLLDISLAGPVRRTDSFEQALLYGESPEGFCREQVLGAALLLMPVTELDLDHATAKLS